MLTTAKEFACSAVTWIVFLGVAAAAQFVFGVYLQWGAGWACIASGIACLSAGWVIRQGVVRG